MLVKFSNGEDWMETTLSVLRICTPIVRSESQPLPRLFCAGYHPVGWTSPGWYILYTSDSTRWEGASVNSSFQFAVYLAISVDTEVEHDFSNIVSAGPSYQESLLPLMLYSHCLFSTSFTSSCGIGWKFTIISFQAQAVIPVNNRRTMIAFATATPVAMARKRLQSPPVGMI